MTENFHYKGFFTFYYHPTNQGKVVKEFLREVVTERLRKEARKRPWKDYSLEQKRDAVDLAKYAIHRLSPEMLAKYLDPEYQKGESTEEQNVQTSVSLYHVINLIPKLIVYPAQFDIKNDLACRILKNSFGSVDFEESM